MQKFVSSHWIAFIEIMLILYKFIVYIENFLCFYRDYYFIRILGIHIIISFIVFYIRFAPFFAQHTTAMRASEYYTNFVAYPQETSSSICSSGIKFLKCRAYLRKVNTRSRKFATYEPRVATRRLLTIYVTHMLVDRADDFCVCAAEAAVKPKLYSHWLN